MFRSDKQPEASWQNAEHDRPVMMLDYRTAPPPPLLKDALRNVPEQIAEAFGGLNWMLFTISLGFMACGIFGMAPCLMIWIYLIDRWSKSSRWF